MNIIIQKDYTLLSVNQNNCTHIPLYLTHPPTPPMATTNFCI